MYWATNTLTACQFIFHVQRCLLLIIKLIYYFPLHISVLQCRTARSCMPTSAVFWPLFYRRPQSTPGPWYGRKEMSLKNPVTPLGIDPGTVRLVAQRLRPPRHPRPFIVLWTYPQILRGTRTVASYARIAHGFSEPWALNITCRQKLRMVLNF